MTIEKISRGMTFKGATAVIGSVFFVLGLLIIIPQINSEISIVFFTLGIIVTSLGLVLFFSIQGVLIDKEKRLIKPYFDLIIIKLGSWESIERYDKIILKYINTSQTMNSRANSTKYRTKSYDIVLSSNKNEELILKEFVDYSKAQSFLVDYSQRLDKESIDEYKILTERIKERRQKVKR